VSSFLLEYSVMVSPVGICVSLVIRIVADHTFLGPGEPVAANTFL